MLPLLVIFDVDGTLVRSSGIDGELFARTFEAQFGVALPSTDWGDYAFVTDQGISEEALARLGKGRDGIPAFKARFLAALGDALRASPVEPVSGARSVVRELLRAGHRVALATGGWIDSARLKLTSSAVDVAGSMLVGSDELRDRADIIRAAMELAGARDLRTVYVGDARWDAVATAALSLPFVGVDASGSGQLAKLGVEPVVDGYGDLAAFTKALAGARIWRPRPG
jgi:phosphoglycolate phosphatase-like HAD superfamily hydrolase